MRILPLLLLAMALSAEDNTAPRSYSLTLSQNDKTFTVVWLLNYKDLVGIVQTPLGEDVKDVIFMKSDKDGVTLKLKDELVPHGTVILYNKGNISKFSTEESVKIYDITNSINDSNRQRLEYKLLGIINKPGG